MTVTTVRFFAAARAAVGTDEVAVDVDAMDVASLDAALAGIEAADPERWSALVERCSYLVDGVSTRDRATSLVGVGTVDVMPPFAGG
ncbi:molybdopterin converting factor small subunit [Curtobacterium luteum]|uniref:Molybdopterin converting factor small subunit n=1 Tax=Curtobacterium luteum TaxID=33881 RepID=A0A7Y6EI93_9MICO|nr:MoaD/ThiS family protein [Curtobacterium luteum]MBM7802536.1 molybdopterin converting factor small subunit [Curtobacterium luteum]NUU50339.1 MoaD/ThiS family protein [Curtobacterium luteum]NUU50344.1 MoaD/ThiS family protein [Curtobacterium luteum]GGL07098.1 molybdopterin synthase sulfur carrier subunit [Curtobacterium luteum]